MFKLSFFTKASFSFMFILSVMFVAGTRDTRADDLPTADGQELTSQAAMGSAFTFHGQLAKSGAAYNGTCDFTFSLWDAAVGGVQIGSNQSLAGVSVSGGVFSVVLNSAGQFGANAFNGSARWLNTQVKCGGDAAMTDLGRQGLLATPYALYAIEAGSVAPSSGQSIVAAINDPATAGTISDNRLTPNVARVNAPNTWTGVQTFNAGLSANNAPVSNVANPTLAGDATNKAYVDSNFVKFVPGAEQLSVGDANGTATMINLRGGSTCCSGPGGHTPAWFKVFQNGSFVATGNLGIGTSPMEGQGYRTSWHTYKGAFRSGYADNEWDDANVGFFSWAGGSNSTASGLYALAFGDTNFARSTSSIAFGSGNEVKGAAGFSAGAGNRVCDTYGVALGNNARSGGPYINGKCDPETFNIRGLAAVAIGYNVTADQDHTMALGKFASNNGFQGTFIWSDGAPQASADTFRNTANNEFAARATGGFRFRTNLSGTTGCNLPAGSGVFNCTSDRNQKENFKAVNGEQVLSKLAEINVKGWNYKDDPLKTQHVGPTAQDFYGAFGLGTNDKEIGMLDIDGINMLAIQALEKRTSEVKVLETRVAQLEAEKITSVQQFSALEKRLAALEQASGITPAQQSLPWIWLIGGALLLTGMMLGTYRFASFKRR